MYTRDGRFHMNAQNELVTSDGSLVLNRNNAPIILENEQALEFIQVNGEDNYSISGPARRSQAEICL